MTLFCWALAGCGDDAKDPSSETWVDAEDADSDGSLASEDCADADSAVYPGADEACDGLDNNCDGAVDEGVLTVFYADIDGDGLDDLVLGAPDHNDGLGQVWVVLSTAARDALVDDEGLALSSSTHGPDFGAAVAGLGDYDGDGYDDFAVGAPNSRGRASLGGAAFVVLVGVTALPSVDDPYAALVGNEPDRHMGANVAAVGDFDGDGLADLLVGQSGDDSGDWSGSVALLLGGTEGSVTTFRSAAMFYGDAGGRIGNHLDGAGDVDGDGLGDFVVGDGHVNGSDAWSGQVYVVLGGSPASMDLSDADLVVDGGGFREGLGEGVAGAGDVNGDGSDDLLFGASRSDLDGRRAGRAYLFHGPVSGRQTMADAAVQLHAASSEGEVGHALAGGGNTNGDVAADILVGAPGEDSTLGGGAYRVEGLGI